ncbi:MAG: hypothetical protein EH225_10015 [Calditrichaeota bacterium]|nr:hypothetical protein [Calditrichota bacterium]RQW00947.1 MAG: hypothetical protein EH225_10015 [Calditrichota bacterium]
MYPENFFRNGGLFLTILILGILLVIPMSCDQENGPSDEIIRMARESANAIIDSVRASQELVESEPELVNENYNEDLEQYELEFHIETGFGSALTNSPKAYIIKDKNRWKFRMIYGGTHEFYLDKSK